jgi:acetyl esterase/lipase
MIFGATMHLPRSLRFGPAKAALTLGLLGLAAVTPSAAANVPPPVTKTNTIRVPVLGNSPDGSLTTTVTYSDTTASARSSTGNTIGLNTGYVFRLRTCVAYHLSGTPPVSKCAERTVDTSANTAAVYTRAPTVTLPEQPRPTTEPWGYFTPYVEVDYQEASAWPVIAHSWPDGGLSGAGIAVAPADQTEGVLPPNSTVMLDGAFNSAINSGQPDSICTANPAPSSGPLPPGVTSSHPGFAGAPAYYEVGLPTGAHAGEAPRGVMLIVHGGGWSIIGAGGVQSMRPDADRWRARGWETVNLTYRPCGQSLEDVLWFYDHARTWFGPDAAIAALGTSAGGHLALLLAANRAGVYGVVSQAGPTDLGTIQDEPVYNPATGLFDSTLGSRWVHNLGASAFGEENLPAYSPATQAASTLNAARVLQAFSADDAIVPYAQAADLANAMLLANPAAYVDNLQLATGTFPFGHGRVTEAALQTFHARERQLVAPIIAPTVPLDRR